MNQMSTEQKVGPELITSILKEVKEPITTKQLQQEVLKQVPFCISSNIVALNMMRIAGIIKGKRREDGAWVWWFEDKEK